MPAFNWGDFFKEYGGAILGAGLTLVGDNQQQVDNTAAQNTNLAAIDKLNQSAWTNYLMTRGIAPTTPVAAGVLPARGAYQTVNQKLPLWATMPASAPSSGQRWVKRT